jgi:hypothetical protein
MKRKRLSELVREEIASPVAARREHQEVAPSPGEYPGDLAAPSLGERVPPYLSYVRKECRLRPDQLDTLTALARRLNRERRGGERITENTLLRLAADLLLSLGEEEVARLLEKGGPAAGDSS